MADIKSRITGRLNLGPWLLQRRTREGPTMRDTIDMAREAGIIHPEMVLNTLKAFEALVRADEREAMLHLALLHAAPWHFQEAIRARGNT